MFFYGVFFRHGPRRVTEPKQTLLVEQGGDKARYEVVKGTVVLVIRLTPRLKVSGGFFDLTLLQEGTPLFELGGEFLATFFPDEILRPSLQRFMFA